jgi:hypothetical protein
MASINGQASGSADPRVADVIAANFEGDAALYAAFAAACAAQFPFDIQCGDDACAAADMARLGRLAHDLKSALTLLGRVEAGSLAARIEEAAVAGDIATARSDWKVLRRVLQHAG